MKKFLTITLAMLLVLGSFAKSNFNKVNTVYTNIPVKIIFKEDSTFGVILNKYDEKYVHYEVVNDTVLKITHKGLNWFEMNEKTPVVKIKTPRTLNVECSRYLRIN
jgi:hypothetical protein